MARLSTGSNGAVCLAGVAHEEFDLYKRRQGLELGCESMRHEQGPEGTAWLISA